MGKVHGGLSRAGKVKAQTPKVPEQDGRNKPLSRAKERMQHFRRFVTAVGGCGKKGPNSNSR